METTATKTEGKSFREKVIDVIQEEVPDHLNSFAYCLGATPLILFIILRTSAL